MAKKRKLPRVGCSVPCELHLSKNTIISGYVTDVSASGFGFVPDNGEIPVDIELGETFVFIINMMEFSDIGKNITFEASSQWIRGLMVGFKIESIDKPNFKRWWYLIYTLFFPKLIDGKWV